MKDIHVLKKLTGLLVGAMLTSQAEVIATPKYQVDKLVSNQGEPLSDWITHNQAFSINLKTPLSPAASNLEKNLPLKMSPITSDLTQHIETAVLFEFQILLGDSDITSLFELQDRQLVFLGGIPLPSGENEILVSQFVDGQWVEIGSHNLNVLTSNGFKQAKWTPRLEININSQLNESVSGDSVESERPTFNDASANIGFSGYHQNDALTMETNINLFAVSNREQAIQFATRNNLASKLDVADYSVNLANGSHQLIVGHTSYGNNSLLIDNLSRRGVSWQYQNDNELTFNGAILSGSDLVGYNNFLGLSDYSEQFVKSVGVGFKVLKDSRISLRIEGVYLDAQKQSINDFGVGAVTSSENNEGMGLRVTAADAESRIDADLTLGLSSYNNPQDAELSQGDTLVELKVKDALAHNLNLNYLLIQDWETSWGTIANISVNANHSSVAPLYQTLTASIQANVESSRLGAHYQFGNLTGNLAVQTSRDNLDNIVSLLTTKINIDSFSFNAPLAQIISDFVSQENSVWIPILDFSFQKMHQFATNSPDFQLSGFNDNSHLPNQLTTNNQLTSSWQFEAVSFSLQSIHSEQDNRQVGREQSDLTNLLNSVNLNIQQNESTSWGVSLSKNRALNQEDSNVQISQSASVSYNWQSLEHLAFAVNYGFSKETDSLNKTKNTSTTFALSIAKNLINGDWWLPFDGNVTLRLNYNDSKQVDNVFEQNSYFGTSTAQLGINLSF
jgi:hypothetical protein